MTAAAPAPALAAEPIRFAHAPSYRGYGTEHLSGTYTGPATAKDVEARFFGPLGGREAWARDGQWGCVVYTD